MATITRQLLDIVTRLDPRRRQEILRPLEYEFTGRDFRGQGDRGAYADD
jgi:hypothetical protein